MKKPIKNNLSGSAAGLRACLQDKSVKWINRVKIIRHIWTNDVAAFPNKRQFLLDLIFEYLTTKRRELTGGEHCAVWKCFDEMLQSHGKSGQTSCMIKSSVIQFLLDQLELCTTPGHDEQLEGYIISCCQTLLTSLGTSFSVISKFENMLRLLSAAVTLATQTYNIDSNRLNCLNLIQAAIPVYLSAQRQKAASRQVMTQVSVKLLGPSLAWIMLTETQRDSADVDVQSLSQSCVKELKETLSAAMFHKDWLQYYDLYLKLKMKIQDEKTELALPKFIDAFFDRLHAKLQSSETQKSVLHGLPFLFTEFTANYRKVSPDLPLMFLQYICSDVLDIKLTLSRSLKSTSSSASEETPMDVDLVAVSDVSRLDVLSLLLGCVYNTEVYDSGSEDILAWFSSIVDWLLSLDTRCSSFYECFRWIQLLSPSCWWKTFPQILASVWSTNTVETTADVNTSQDQLLTEIVTTNSKMKRMDKFVSQMLEAIRMMNTASACFPKKFMNSLSNSFKNTQQKSILRIWNILNQEFSRSYHDFVGLEAVCHLTCVFLHSIHIVDLVRINADLKEFEDQYNVTLKSVLTLLKAVCLDSVNWSSVEACSCLNLLWACGELRIYVPTGSAADISKMMDRSKVSTVSEGSHFSDLSFLYTGLEPKQWFDVHEAVVAKSDWKLRFLWNRLLCQRFNVGCLRLDSVDRQLCDYIILGELCRVNAQSDCCWDGQVPSQTVDTYPVALWSLICDHVHNIYNLKPDQTGSTRRYYATLSDFIVQTMPNPISTPSYDSCQEEVTLSSLTLRLIVNKRADVFQSMTCIHAHVITAMLRSIAVLITSFNASRVSPKKKSDELARISFSSLVEKLMHSFEDFSQKDGICAAEKQLLVEIDELLFKSKSFVLSAETCKQLHRTVQILYFLPLLQLGTTDQARTFLISLLLLWLFGTVRNVHAIGENVDLMRPVLWEFMAASNSGHGVKMLLMNGLHTGRLMFFLSSLRDNIQLESTIGSSIDAKSLQYCDEIIRLIMSHALTELSCIQQLNFFTESIVTKLKEISSTIFSVDRTTISAGSGSHDVTCAAIFHLVKTMKICYKILRHHVKPELLGPVTIMRDILRSQFSVSLCDWSSFVRTQSKEDCNLNGFFVHLITGLTFLLEQHVQQEHKAYTEVSLSTVPSDQDGAQNNADVVSMDTDDVAVANGSVNITKTLLNLVPGLCSVSLQCLRQHEEHTIVQTCLSFIRVASHLLPEQLQKQYLDDVWTLSFVKLRQLRPVEGVAVSTDGKSTAPPRAVVLRSMSETRQVVRSADGTESCRIIESEWIQTLLAILRAVDPWQFNIYMSDLTKNMEVRHMSTNPHLIVVALDAVQHFIRYDMRTDVLDDFHSHCRKILLLVQQLLMHTPTSVDVVVAALQVQTKILSISTILNTESFLTAHEIALCLESFSSTTFESMTLSLSDFSRMHNAGYSLLNSLLLEYKDIVCKMVPSYINGVKILLFAVVSRGCQQPGVVYSLKEIEVLMSCASNIDRLAGLMWENERDFKKVAHYLIADYVQAQKGTLYPDVKGVLELAVGQLFKISSSKSKYAIDQLKTVLPPHSKEAFSVLHRDYQNEQTKVWKEK